jgi:hypothetical protein
MAFLLEGVMHFPAPGALFFGARAELRAEGRNANKR